MLNIYRQRYILTFKAAPKSFPGLFLRGALGAHLKHILPASDYDYVFNTPTDSNIMTKYEQAPKAFVVDLPQYNPSGRLECNLILFGGAREYADQFRQAMGALGEHNRISIEYAGAETMCCSQKDLPERFRLEFVTPTVLHYSGKSCSSPDFHIIVRSLMRRVFLLGHFHYGVRMPFDFKSIIASAQRVRMESSLCSLEKMERDSSRTGLGMTMSGHMGQAIYHAGEDVGNRGVIANLLSLAEWVHCGKFSVFGCGKIISSRVYEGASHELQSIRDHRNDSVALVHG